MASEGLTVACEGEIYAEDGVLRPHRHPVFYLSGQIVVFKVHETLFKVDPTLFTNGEASVLKTMLTLPQGSDVLQEGSDDSTPITLQGDTPEEFASLIWGLYTQHLGQARVAGDDTEQFIRLAKISHKYDLQCLEAWATSGLSRLSENDLSVRRSQAAPLLDVFTLCHCSGETKLVLATIKEMLKEQTCSTTQISAFIDLGERSNLSSLVGLGYYAMMLKPRSEWEAEPSFTHAHRYRLLNGHYALSEYALQDIIESLKVDYKRYFEGWGTAWSNFATPSEELKLRLAQKRKVVDVIGRMRTLLEEFLLKHPSPSGLDTHKPVFRDILERYINQIIEDDLPKYFA